MDVEDNRSSKNLSDQTITDDDGVLAKTGAKQQKPSKKIEKPKVDVIIKDDDDLMRHLELMHDRCITRNLQAAGLGGLDPEQENLVYGNLDPNAKMITGETMLVAVLYKLKDPDKQIRYISILLNEGADPNCIDSEGRTALMHACTLGLEKSSKTLLHYVTTDLALKDRNGNSALMLAAANGYEKIVKAYMKELRKWDKRLQRKRVKSSEEETASVANSIYLAGDAEHMFAENMLEIRNHQGESAYDLAIQNEHFECAKILEAEKSHHVKMLQRKLISLNHDKRRNSNSAVISMQAAKESLTRRYTRTFGSFDDLFDRNREDKSDDELMSDKLTNFSHRISIVNTAATQSNPNLTGDYLNMNQQLESTSYRTNYGDHQQKVNNNGSATSAAGVIVGPDFEKLSFWEDFFPHTRLGNHTLSSDNEPKTKTDNYGGMKKSNTESSLSSYNNQKHALGTSPAKRTLAQRLVGLLKRRSKQHLPTSSEDEHPQNGASADNDCNAKLRKGISQPELMRKVSKESASNPIAGNMAHQRLINIVDKRRKSTDSNIGKTLKSVYQQQQQQHEQQQQQQQHVDLMQDHASSGFNDYVQVAQKFNSTHIVEQHQQQPQINQGDLYMSDSPHSSLKVRSSLPAISKRSVPNKLPLAPIIDHALIDHSSVDARRKSFDLLQMKFK